MMTSQHQNSQCSQKKTIFSTTEHLGKNGPSRFLFMSLWRRYTYHRTVKKGGTYLCKYDHHSRQPSSMLSQHKFTSSIFRDLVLKKYWKTSLRNLINPKTILEIINTHLICRVAIPNDQLPILWSGHQVTRIARPVHGVDLRQMTSQRFLCVQNHATGGGDVECSLTEWGVTCCIAHLLQRQTTFFFILSTNNVFDNLLRYKQLTSSSSHTQTDNSNVDIHVLIKSTCATNTTKFLKKKTVYLAPILYKNFILNKQIF